MKTTIRDLLPLFLVVASAAHAQTAGVVTLRANSTSATGSLVPVLTWSTSPAATSCRASGGWSGTKGASGTATLPVIRASTNYTLTCSWGNGSARVAWNTPTTNTNGSTLTNLAGFRVYYGTSSSSLTQTSSINDVGARSTTISSLTPGTWYFKVRAVNTNQVESNDSNLASKAVAGASASGSLSIAIRPSTGTGTGTMQTIATSIYDVVRDANGRWVLGRAVGRAYAGTPCRTYHLTGDYYGVQTGYVTIAIRPRSTTLVGHCAVR